jgi:hypothetical protein
MKTNEAEAGRGVALFQQAWTAPKVGHDAGQNEDAWRTTLSQMNDRFTLLVAVADGATEAVYSRLWAAALVEAAAPDWPTLGDDELNAQLNEVRAAFKPFAEGADMPWYVQTKWLTLGSQATLLVATVAGARGSDEVEVKAVAVGDSCLLLFRRGEPQVLSFPVESSEGFGVNPSLVRSRFRDALTFRRLPPTRLRPGDLLVACTDAVGKWALKCVEGGRARLVFDALLELVAEEAEGSGEAASAAPAEAATREAEAAAAEVAQPVKRAASQQIIIPVVKSAPRPERARFIPRWRVPEVVQEWFPKVFGPPPAEQAEQRDQAPSPTDGQSPPEACDTVVSAPEAPPPNDGPPAPPENTEAARPKFEQFVARFRAPDAEPGMGNDDSTLVLCVPLPGAGDGQRREALKVIRGYRDTAG